MWNFNPPPTQFNFGGTAPLTRTVSGDVGVLENNDACYLDDPGSGGNMLRSSAPFADLPRTFQDIESNPAINKLDPRSFQIHEKIGSGTFLNVTRISGY